MSNKNKMLSIEVTTALVWPTKVRYHCSTAPDCVRPVQSKIMQSTLL